MIKSDFLQENMAQCGMRKFQKKIDLILKKYSISLKKGKVWVHLSITVEAMTYKEG